MLLLILALLAIFTCSSGQAFDSKANWTVTVENNTIWRTIPDCAKQCVLTINEQVFDAEQDRFCQSTGCVCSDDARGGTRGINYNHAEGNVTECARRRCDDGEVVDTVRKFSLICAIPALVNNGTEIDENGILRLNGTGFEDLWPCGQWLFNGCLDVNGNHDWTECGPKNKPTHWESWRGLADARECRTLECMCNGTTSFNATYDSLHDAGVDYCSLRPSQEGNRNAESDAIDNVLAMTCAGAGYPPDGFSYTYRGKKPDATGDRSSKIMNAKEGWVVIGQPILMALLAIYAAVVSHKTYRFMKTMKKQKDSMREQEEKVNEMKQVKGKARQD